MIPVKRFKVVSIALFLLLLVFGRATTCAQSTANAKRPERHALPEPKPPLPITKHMKPPGPYTDDDFLVGDYAEDYCCGTLSSTHLSPPAGSIRRTGLTIKGRGVVTSITPVQLDGWSAVVGIAGKRQHQPIICTFESRGGPSDISSFILNGVKVGDTVVVHGAGLNEDAPLNASEMQERAMAKQLSGSTPQFRCRLTNLSDPNLHIDRYGSSRYDWDPRCQWNDGSPGWHPRPPQGSALDKYCSVTERN